MLAPFFFCFYEHLINGCMKQTHTPPIYGKGTPYLSEYSTSTHSHSIFHTRTWPFYSNLIRGVLLKESTWLVYAGPFFNLRTSSCNTLHSLFDNYTNLYLVIVDRTQLLGQQFYSSYYTPKGTIPLRCIIYISHSLLIEAVLF